VFGGNILHSFNVPMQLRIYEIEDRTRVRRLLALLGVRQPFWRSLQSPSLPLPVLSWASSWE
jgi:hypothetical protein